MAHLPVDASVLINAYDVYPANTRRWPDVGSMFYVHDAGPTFKPTSVQRLVYAGYEANVG